jgi:hypothetical protein
MKTFRVLLYSFALSLLAASALAYGEVPFTMVNPAIDNEGPFTYLAYPNLEMAMMGGKVGFQLTYDGAFMNRESELCFFSGKNLKPVMVRPKTMLDGYIPVFQYQWNEGNILYQVESFAWTLDDNPESTPVAFIRVKYTNQGKKKADAAITSALRFSGKFKRFDYNPPYAFSTGWIYRMENNQIIRNSKMMFLTPPNGKKFAVAGVPYQKPFNGDDYYITDRAEACLSQFAKTLAPGESRTLDFKYPYRSYPTDSTAAINALQAAAYDTYRAKCVSFWKKELAKGMQVSIPEKKANDAWKANLVYDFMAIYPSKIEGAWVPSVNRFQYCGFWLRDGGYIVRSYDMYSHHSTAARCLKNFTQYQKENGNFESQEGQTDGFGQALFALGEHYFMTGDRAYAESIYKHFPPAVEYLKKARAKDPLHLLPATSVADNELITGHYTGHNFWALAGLKTALRLAKALGKTEDAKTFQAEYDDYYKAFMAQLEKTAGKDGYIPPGLDAEGGEDWGNFIGVFPSEVLDPFDPRIKASLDKVHRDKYAEGVMTYQNRIHQYVTVKVTQNSVYRGDQEQTLQDYYHILLHMGAANEMFEWKAQPYGNRDVMNNYPPHGWGSAMFTSLFRNMLIAERGGNSGIDYRDLHLFTAISPEWAKPGEAVSFTNAATEVGPCSASLKFAKDGAVLEFSPQYRTQPRQVVLHIPYFVELKSYTTNAKTHRLENGNLILSPDVRQVSLKWDYKKKIEPLNFDKVVKDYRAEYARRYQEYLKAGNKPVVVEAPKLLTAEERKQDFAAKYIKKDFVEPPQE